MAGLDELLRDRIIRSNGLAGALHAMNPESDGRGYSFPLPFGMQGPIVATEDAPQFVIDHEKGHIAAGMDTQKNQLNDMMYLLKPPARDLPQPYEAPSAGMASRLMQKRGM